MKSKLDCLRFACSNGLLADISYQGGTLGTRLVYPYSIQSVANGNVHLCGFCIPHAGERKIERYIVSLISDVVITPILAEEQGYNPNQEWLFRYKVPSLFSPALVRANDHFTNGVLDVSGWKKLSTDKRSEIISNWINGREGIPQAKKK